MAFAISFFLFSVYLIFSNPYKYSGQSYLPGFKGRLNIGDISVLRKPAVPQEVGIRNKSPYNESYDTWNKSRMTVNSEEMIISDTPLPAKVYDAQKNKISIELRIYRQGRSNYSPDIAMGTGYIFAPGFVLTARHILMEMLLRGVRSGYTYVIGSDGLPKGLNYSYEFFGSIAGAEKELKFPLSLEAMGELGTFKDLMVLKVDATAMDFARKFKPQGKTGHNPYAPLLSTAVFNTDAVLAEKIFMAGIHDVPSYFINKDGNEELVLAAKRNYVFEGSITQRIEHLPINKLGIIRFYEVKGEAEGGFSGGPAFNSEGEVVGTIIEKAGPFAYLISSRDAIDFLREHKFIKN